MSAGGRPVPVLLVPEIRDYQRINAELAHALDEGAAEVRLAGVDGQRLLVAGLAGPWRARVIVEGPAGPELAAGLDAPGLVVIGTAGAADGAGAGMRAGRLVVRGEAGDSVGFAQRGGSIVVHGRAGHRAGLAQSGGTLVLLGGCGRLAGDRQSGGRLFVTAEGVGPHLGHGRRGGILVRLGPGGEPIDAGEADREALASAIEAEG